MRSRAITPSTGQFIAWVQVPAVSHTTDTVIYLFYGNASIVTSQENKAGVWDAGYKAVYHLGNGVALGLLGFDSQRQHADQQCGEQRRRVRLRVEEALTEARSSLTCGMANYPSGNSAYTISGWMNPGQQNTHRDKLLSYGNTATAQGTFFGIDQNNNITIDHYSDDYTSSTTIPDGAWTYLTVTYDGTTDTVYKNGALAFTHVPAGTAAGDVERVHHRQFHRPGERHHAGVVGRDPGVERGAVGGLDRDRVRQPEQPGGVLHAGG